MKSEYRQVVKLAQPGELKAYVVFEHQLDLLAQGSPVSLLLNFALFFLGVAATSLGTIATAPPTQDRVYYTFLIIFLVTLIAGIVLLAVWYSMRRSVASLIVEIKGRCPRTRRSSKVLRSGSIRARRSYTAAHRLNPHFASHGWGRSCPDDRREDLFQDMQRGDLFQDRISSRTCNVVAPGDRISSRTCNVVAPRR